MFDMRRREFITLLGGAAAAWPLAARAQQPALPVIGFLNGGSPQPRAHLVAAFRQGLREIGFVEGQNVAIEYRWADDRNERLPALAAELASRQVAVIAALGGPAAVAAKAATATIPIVFQVGVDPVAKGLVASMNRPGGNVTGVTVMSRELNGKKLELLVGLVPEAAAIAVLLNPSNPNNEIFTSDIKAAARALGQQILTVNVSNEGDLDAALTNLIPQHADALVVTNDALFTSRRDHIVALAARHKIPAIYAYREFPAAGGLMSYGTSLAEGFRQVGIYTGRILKGATPADLPVMEPMRFELVINLKAAKALGLEVSATLLARADEVIE
jgi:putative ABC transport system substrate-binding protein